MPFALRPVFLLLIAFMFTTAAAQEATPLPDIELQGVIGLPQSTTPQGYPQLGDVGAPVQVVAFCGVGVAECSVFQREVFPALLPAVSNGEVAYSAIPLTGDDIANSRGAARAALCAGEQGAYWPYADWLYAGEADDAFDSARLLSGLETLALDRAVWDECMLSDRPDITLEAAAATLDLQLQYTGSLPFVLVNRVPSLPDAESILSAVALELAEATEAAAEATSESTDAPLVVTVEPLLGEAFEPPLTIDLPTDWQFGYDTLILSDVDGSIRTVPLAIYTGSVNGGQGTIVLLWGFPNLFAGNPLTGGAGPDLWSDGLRLLRLAIIEQGCNVGTDLRTEYEIGGLAAAGTQFSAVDCPVLPDTRGWFAGLQQNGINFVFYAFTDPIEAMGTAQGELQTVLDSVVFHVADFAPPTAAP